MTEEHSAGPLPDYDSIRLRGEREYFSHRGEYQNPFPIGSSGYNAYERGWYKSMKFNGGKLVNRKVLVAAPQRRSAPSTDYNAYAEAKARSVPRK